MLTGPINFATSAQMTSSWASSAFDISKKYGLNIQATYVSGTTGIMSVWGSNDGINWTKDPNATPTATNESSSGSFMWNLPNTYYQKVQVQWSAAAGSTGIAQVVGYAKGNTH